MRFVGVDPATVTGFVALDQTGQVLVETELKGKGRAEKGGITSEQLASLCSQLYKSLLPEDEIVKEDAAPGTQKAISTGKIHGGLEVMIQFKKLIPNIVSPNAVKKYVGVSGWKGELGKKVRLEDDEKKAAVKDAVLRHFGYTHKSHNIVDAYIMARIAWNLYLCRELLPMIDTLPYQVEVVKSILKGGDGG